MNLKIIVCLLGIAITSKVSAQVLIQADISAVQPTISRDETGFSACGVRSVVTVISGVKADVYDFSVNAYAASFTGLIKAGRYRTTFPAKPGAHLPVAGLPAPVGFWMAAADQGVPARPSKIIPADTKGFVLGSIPIEQAVKGIFDIAHGNQVQFAVRYADEQVDRAINFRKQMEDADMGALQLCMDGLIVRLNKELESKKE